MLTPPFPLESYLWGVSDEERTAVKGSYLASITANIQQRPVEEEVYDIDEESLIDSEKMFEDIRRMNEADQHDREEKESK